MVDIRQVVLIRCWFLVLHLIMQVHQIRRPRSLSGMVFHRHISTSEICEIYRTDPEDPLHALWLCKELDCVQVSLLGT